MDYPIAYLAFSQTYADMRARLLKWLTDNGGAIDGEGTISGLLTNQEIHFHQRNDQLNVILEYATATTAALKEKQNEIEKLKTQVRLLETAERERAVSNRAVLDRISELLSWEIEKKHSLDDFRRAMRDTIFFVELGIKRKLLDFDKRTQSKLHWSKYYLQNDVEARSFFFNKKRTLEFQSKEITVQTLSLTTVVPSINATIGA